mmetsp:Transcript_72056/g.134707  ORF Transcript_72056/g.134707 Transcript_72056/m.134707 type:complete len:213 (+) Transcript_72056:649-1287(+)
MLPHIATPAPRHKALTMCPGLLMPPSAMIGTSYLLASFATLYTADACARPHAHTSCVVQMDPMPMPTRKPSAPQSIRFFACRFVTTLPAMTWMSGNSCLIHLTMSCWKVLSPWLLSMTIASTPASWSNFTRSLSCGRVPMAAATTSLFLESLVAKGNSAFLLRSFLAISAVSLPVLLTMGSFPFLLSLRVALAAASSTPSSAVIKSCTGVMT